MTRRTMALVTAASLLGALAASSRAAETPKPAEETQAMKKNPIVVITTSKGDIEAELFADKAPISVENFVTYAKAGHYDGTIFHRVIPGFMIQGGGLTPDMKDKPTRAPIKNEADNGLKNKTGTLAMARTGVVDSATSQFFINTVDNAFLDHKSKTPQGYGYAVFGTVTKGMDVVKAIEGVKTANKGMHQDVPVEAVMIEKVTVKE